MTVVVAIDPAVTSKPDSDETGIVVAEDVRTDDEGNVLGDRIRIVVTEDWVSLVHESMQKHSDENEKQYDWDWKVDPEAGVSMSIAHAKEMMAALSRLLT